MLHALWVEDTFHRPSTRLLFLRRQKHARTQYAEIDVGAHEWALYVVPLHSRYCTATLNSTAIDLRTASCISWLSCGFDTVFM